MKCGFRRAGSPIAVDATAATHLYRIAQESISNAIKHGKADRIDVRLAGSSGSGVLTIRDNGSSVVNHPKRHDGRGLQIMAYRAPLIGATIETRRPRGRGRW